MKAAGAQKQRSGSFHCFCFHLHTDCLRSGRAGPPFSARPEKEAKGAVSHGTSAAERSRHVKSRSANLPKLSRSRGFRHMGRFVLALRAKIPSRATQIIAAGAASAFRGIFTPQLVSSAIYLSGTVIFSQWPVAQSIKYDHKTLLTPCFCQRRC